MTLEEAMQKFGIPIPENIYDYDKEKYHKFDNMYLQCFYSTFYTTSKNGTMDNTSGKKVAVVLGGQTGAGKGSLSVETKREFDSQGRRIIIIDDDSFRKLYPDGQEILKKCPEHYTKITATATGVITPKILKFASDNGYNFIFDGTMKNPRIIETMKGWKGYDIYVKVMATSMSRSLLSTAIRNGELRRIGEEGRYISIEGHDETYHGIPDTLNYLESTGLAEEIMVYTRGVDPFYPKKQYSSKENKQEHSYEVLKRLRDEDEKLFLTEADKDLGYLESLSLDLSETERAEAERIINLIRDRISRNADAR